MPDITEYGDLMPNAIVDEWGRRRIDGLLEDGAKIIVAIGIILKQWSQTGYTTHAFNRPFRSMKLTQNLNASHVYSRPFCSLKLTQTLNLAHAFIRHRLMRFTQALKTLHMWTVEYPALILKQWFATLQTAHTLKRPQRLIQITQTLQTVHTFSRPVRIVKLPAIIRLIHAHFVAFPGVKKTKLFLIIGDLAVQLSGD